MRGCVNKTEPKKLWEGSERERGFGAPMEEGGILRRSLAGARPGKGVRGRTKGDGFPQSQPPARQHKPLCVPPAPGGHQPEKAGKKRCGPAG